MRALRTERRGADAGPWAGGAAEESEDGAGGPWPAEAAAWGEDARHIFEERLAVAADLEMDLAPGGEAWAAALREARRCAAGVPAGLAHPRGGGPLDVALAAFAPAGGLAYLRTLTPEGYAAMTGAAPAGSIGTPPAVPLKHRNPRPPVTSSREGSHPVLEEAR